MVPESFLASSTNTCRISLSLDRLALDSDSAQAGSISHQPSHTLLLSENRSSVMAADLVIYRLGTDRAENTASNRSHCCGHCLAMGMLSEPLLASQFWLSADIPQALCCMLVQWYEKLELLAVAKLSYWHGKWTESHGTRVNGYQYLLNIEFTRDMTSFYSYDGYLNCGSYWLVECSYWNLSTACKRSSAAAYLIYSVIYDPPLSALNKNSLSCWLVYHLYWVHWDKSYGLVKWTKLCFIDHQTKYHFMGCFIY